MANNCQVSTPTKYVRQMLDFIKYKENIFEKRILENSCGEGNILLEVVKRYIKDAYKQGINNRQIIEGLQHNIVAYEIDAKKIEICVKRLNELVEALGLQNVAWNIKNQDFLKDSKETYDYIIGNPPYITYHDLNKTEREYLKENFVSCKEGRFDYSYAFIEASVKALNKNGKLIYLLPYSIIKNKFAVNLRDYISPYIVGIYDYAGIKVFPDAITSSVILLGKRLAKPKDWKESKNLPYTLETNGR
ncbi:MAG: N-6 DNA methylase [Lachnospiraceae bacterium]|nr:N-6 DNA methylase [Lachnospiraceae bacterium]